MKAFILAAAALLAGGVSAKALPAAGTADARRPYEMVWANRTRDAHDPLLALTDAAGWTVETQNAVATFARARRTACCSATACAASRTARRASPRPFA